MRKNAIFTAIFLATYILVAVLFNRIFGNQFFILEELAKAFITLILIAMGMMFSNVLRK